MDKRPISRRWLLRAGPAGALAAVGVGLPRRAVARAAAEHLALLNTHTGERVDVPLREAGVLRPDSVEAVEQILRDHRSGERHAIDPALLEQLLALRTRLAAPVEFHVISGYRSPATNAMLAAASGGVARHSLHIEGRAIDLRVPGLDLRALHRAALSLLAGGVGYYARENFVHIDSGRLRRW